MMGNTAGTKLAKRSTGGRGAPGAAATARATTSTRSTIDAAAVDAAAMAPVHARLPKLLVLPQSSLHELNTAKLKQVMLLLLVEPRAAGLGDGSIKHRQCSVASLQLLFSVAHGHPVGVGAAVALLVHGHNSARRKRAGRCAWDAAAPRWQAGRSATGLPKTSCWQARGGTSDVGGRQRTHCFLR